MPTDPYVALNAAVQQVRRAADTFPIDQQLAAQKAAAQVLLDRLPVEYAIWPDDEFPEVTFEHHLHLALDAGLRAQASGAPGVHAVVQRALDDLIEALGYIRTDQGISVPF